MTLAVPGTEGSHRLSAGVAVGLQSAHEPHTASIVRFETAVHYGDHALPIHCELARQRSLLAAVRSAPRIAARRREQSGAAVVPSGAAVVPVRGIGVSGSNAKICAPGNATVPVAWLPIALTARQGCQGSRDFMSPARTIT
jgi:hypothetical protein